jgi:hypothetical protein
MPATRKHLPRLTLSIHERLVFWLVERKMSFRELGRRAHFEVKDIARVPLAPQYIERIAKILKLHDEERRMMHYTAALHSGYDLPPPESY